MTAFYSLYIPAGTKVLGKKGMVELSGDAYISGATREKGGEFYYTIGSQEFYCSSGCCDFWQDSQLIEHSVILEGILKSAFHEFL